MKRRETKKRMNCELGSNVVCLWKLSLTYNYFPWGTTKSVQTMDITVNKIN
jgi:hypothetical protein